jgi:hypothetical protein
VVQLPEVLGVMETTVAVTGTPKVWAAVFFDDFLDAFLVGLPVAVRHEPTVTAEALTVTVCWKVVVGV